MANPLDPLPAQAFGPARAAHLLRRATFGASPAEIRRAVDEGLEATVARLFTESEGSVPAGAIALLLGSGELEPLQAWWMRGLCSGPGGLRERATLMWHAHFATSFQKVRDVRLMHAQNATQRRLALGPFEELLVAMMADPALLIWLDGVENHVGAPNENLARELLELFGLGRGHYEEQDVRELARALTGWRVVGRQARFEPELHDGGVKRILGREGAYGLEGAVRAVVEHPACATWIAGRLMFEFVGPRGSAELAAELAADLRENGLHVGATLARLLSSRGFHTEAVSGTRVASPVEYLAGASRALEVTLPAVRCARLAERMGQSLFQPPTVAGWEGGAAWLDPSAWVARRDAARELDRRAGLPLGGDDALERLLPSQPRPPWADRIDTHAIALVVGSPEFQLH